MTEKQFLTIIYVHLIRINAQTEKTTQKRWLVLKMDLDPVRLGHAICGTNNPDHSQAKLIKCKIHYVCEFLFHASASGVIVFVYTSAMHKTLPHDPCSSNPCFIHYCKRMRHVSVISFIFLNLQATINKHSINGSGTFKYFIKK